MTPPNLIRHQQAILLDQDKAKKLDRLAKLTGLSKQALMREAVDDLLSVYALHRSPRIHGIRHQLTQCEHLMKQVRGGELSDANVQAACAEVIVHINRMLSDLGDGHLSATGHQLTRRNEENRMDEAKTTRAAQYGLGRQVIAAAIQDRLSRNAVKGSVSIGFREHRSNPPEATFEVVANGRSAEHRFAYESIVDSWERLSSGASSEVDELIASILGAG